ncbi:NAD(P)H-dependent flavin oxidoreductase [Chrysiogenes arsenatis]|uniref:NAD(P)H-dependent flavin oxidoreductase n=1 Tax=Chrysiogenes arsenatis TaxID=309797 RepID=UPI0004275FD6|nr:nitronate monooxygenase [Chrysiogenes arsenatis]
MTTIPQLTIGKHQPKVPIIQGGMSVLVSNPSLASAVANAGGIGVIGGTGVEPEKLHNMIVEAKKLTSGIIGVNIMVAANHFMDLVKASFEAKVDMIIAGAGISKQLFKMGQDANVEIVPVISSARVGEFIEKMGAKAVIVESGEAAGHLGTDQPLSEIFAEIKQTLKIPVIAAGGLIDGKGMADMFRLGADGVQLGTRFVLSDECDVHDRYKQAYLNAREEDIVTFLSPVGYPGRAILTPFLTEFIRKGNMKVERCVSCLKSCSHSFCILDALLKARNGDIENGIVFAGKNVYKIKDILPVQKIIDNLMHETREALATN